MATDVITPGNESALGEINKYNFVTETHGIFKARKGLNEAIVSEISEMKREPRWIPLLDLKNTLMKSCESVRKVSVRSKC